MIVLGLIGSKDLTNRSLTAVAVVWWTVGFLSYFRWNPADIYSMQRNVEALVVPMAIAGGGGCFWLEQKVRRKYILLLVLLLLLLVPWLYAHFMENGFETRYGIDFLLEV